MDYIKVCFYSDDLAITIDRLFLRNRQAKNEKKYRKDRKVVKFLQKKPQQNTNGGG